LDLEHVAQFIIDSLHKIVDYDVAGLLLLDEPASLDIQTRAPISEALLAWVRTHILNTLRLTCGVEAEDGLNARVRGVETLEESPRGTPDKLRSFVNVPLTVGGSVVGLVHVSSHRENAFDQDDIAFLNRAADFMASSVQGVRDALAIVKGRIERMVEHMTDGVLMLDRHGDVVAMNGAARAILGMDPQSRKHVRAAELARVLELDAMDLMRAERRTLRKELWLHGVPYQTQLSPIEETVGGLAGAVMAFRNFTEEKQIDEMKSEFINIVSHELRTPLTAIKNAVHLVLGSRLGELNSNQKRFLEMAQRNIDDLVALINDLLDLSKIEAGRMQIPLRPLELSQPIEKSVSSLGPQATEKGIALETTIGSDLPSLYGDAASIQRVVVNLVGNALKFTDRGGRVRVEATSTWEEAGGERRRAVQVTISDTGSGIPKEQLESIFDKFHQVDGSRSQQVAGTGLGLPITRELIKAHHGRIWAESEPGSGSIFSFVIPALTRDQLFFSGLDRDLERARRLTLALALVVVRLFDADRLAGGLGEERYQALLDSVEACAQKAIRRSTDRVELRREKAVLVVVLPDVLREGGEAFTTRLLEEIKATTAGDHVGLGCAFSMFPEQATTAERLYQVAFERTEAKATLTRSESSS
jgi:signal transduction histidine kinase